MSAEIDITGINRAHLLMKLFDSACLPVPALKSPPLSDAEAAGFLSAGFVDVIIGAHILTDLNDPDRVDLTRYVGFNGQDAGSLVTHWINETRKSGERAIAI